MFKKILKTTLSTILLLVVTIMLTGCGKDTAKVGETLNVKNKYNNISIRALSDLEKYEITEGIMYKGDTYGRLQLEIGNNGSDTLKDFGLTIAMALVDADKKDLATANSFITVDDNIYSKSISSGAKETGYVYFADSNINYDNPVKITDSLIDNAKYLKVSIMGKASSKGGKVSVKYDEFYLELK